MRYSEVHRKHGFSDQDTSPNPTRQGSSLQRLAIILMVVKDRLNYIPFVGREAHYGGRWIARLERRRRKGASNDLHSFFGGRPELVGPLAPTVPFPGSSCPGGTANRNGGLK